MKIKVQDEKISTVLKELIEETSSLACAVVGKDNDIISVMGKWEEIEKVSLSEGVRKEIILMGDRVAYSTPIDEKRKLVIIFEGKDRIEWISLRAQRTIDKIWIMTRD